LKVSKINNYVSYKISKNQAKNKAQSKPTTNNNQLSNIYYTPINFQRKWQEHQSWGLRLRTDGSATAKIFTFPDVKKVTLEVNEENYFPLENKKNGVFEAQIQKGEIKAGDKYFFVIERADGIVEKVKDPYSFLQSELMGASVAYNQNAYKWNDGDWYKNNHARISRLANSQNGLTPLGSARIYELNVATLTPKGNFDGVMDELQRIKDTGFNTIEIMPVENTYSYNWGYDGVDKFAVATYMGGPDKLKELVDKAHGLGLNVIMDMVPNHIGPDGSQLGKTGPYLKGTTGWGDAFNYEGKNSKYVRDFMVNAALNWVHNYHCDGLRLDMTQFMKSDVTMQQIAAELNYHYPDVFLIAEDGRSNMSARGDEYWHDWWQPHDQRVVNPLKANEIAQWESEEIHDKKIEDIENFKVPLSRLGFDSEWDFHYHHTLTKLAYGEADLEALERAIVESQNRIKYATSHDEIGNKDGTRVVAKYMVPLLRLNENVGLTDDEVKRAHEYIQYMKNQKNLYVSTETALEMVKAQKVQQISMKLAQMFQSGELTQERISALGINQQSGITAKQVKSAFKEAAQTYRAIEALKYFTPGPIMTFQGEERLEMTKFNFFREFLSIKDEYYLYLEKGYPNGFKAYLDSIIGRREYSKDGLKRMQQFENLIVDLNEFKENNPASNVGKIVVSDTVKHPKNPTIALHSIDKASGNETFVISNFSNIDYPTYEIEFPKGMWQEKINTNDTKYGGSGTCQNSIVVFGLGKDSVNAQKTKISLPAKSTLIFTKI